MGNQRKPMQLANCLIIMSFFSFLHCIIVGLHTHGIWSTSFRLVVTWLTERTYASTDCTGRVGETIKRKGGVSQACLGKSTSLILDIHNMVNWQLSKRDSHWPASHDRHIVGSCVNSSRWHDLFGSCPLTSIDLLDRGLVLLDRIFGGKLRWWMKKKFSVHCLFETILLLYTVKVLLKDKRNKFYCYVNKR